MKKLLKSVTLLGIDCIDTNRLKLAMEICQKNLVFGDVKILSSLRGKKSDHFVKIKKIKSTKEYSEFILTKLYKYVQTPHVLIVQHDGFILNSDAWSNTFLKYDYIGAPWLVGDWAIKNFDFPKKLEGKLVVGNGGFSLRSKKLLSLTAKLAKQKKLLRHNPEDVSICILNKKLFEKNGIKFAPLALAKKFAYEGEDRKHYMWDKQFGFHGLKWTDISKWAKKHPQYKINNPATKKSERNKYL